MVIFDIIGCSKYCCDGNCVSASDNKVVIMTVFVFQSNSQYILKKLSISEYVQYQIIPIPYASLV